MSTKKQKNEYIIYVDGLCHPDSCGIGGCGIVILNQETGEVIEKSIGYQKTNGKRIDILPIITALESLPSVAVVDIYTKSKFAVTSLQGDKQDADLDDLWRQVADASWGKMVTFHLSPGTNTYISRAFELAKSERRKNQLLEDEGYQPLAKETTKSTKSAFQEQIPDILYSYNGKEPEILSVKDYAKEHGISVDCADCIRVFYNSRMRFSDYRDLRTGGMDKYSGMPFDKMVEQTGLPEEVMKILSNILPQWMIASALRWNLRGLLLTDAIRKVQVDKEIKDNYNKAYGNPWSKS